MTKEKKEQQKSATLHSQWAKASREYRERVQADEEKKYNRNKRTTFRSAKLHINKYADEQTLIELKDLIDVRLHELMQEEGLTGNDDLNSKTDAKLDGDDQ
ncbi:hypothetical protein ACWOE8_19545 [Enterococcus avium]